MRALLFSAAVLCLTGCCSDFVPLDQLPTFGDPVPGTIHVVATSEGFKRPGHYYLPEGATLGLLIDVAGWKPVNSVEHETLLNGWRYTHRFLMVKGNKKGERYTEKRFISQLDKEGMPFQHRECRLLDGDRVIRSGISL